MHSAIKIEQRITGDFLEYISRGSLELEVYGKRKSAGVPSLSPWVVPRITPWGKVRASERTKIAAVTMKMVVRRKSRGRKRG